jgi:hypothetical protein
MPKICLSYRRADSVAITGRIYDRLVQYYGSESVFMDIDNIPFGTDFREHIGEVLGISDILIAVIGLQWLGPTKSGRPRIFEKSDPVRVEIDTALQRQMHVIPVLVEGAKMPTDGELPESLKEFAFRNAIEIDPGRDFSVHMDRLIRATDQIGNSAKANAPTHRSAVESVADKDSMNDLVGANVLEKPSRGIVGRVFAHAFVVIAAILLAHYLVVVKFDLSAIYLRTAIFLVALIGGYANFRQLRSDWKLALFIGVLVGISSVIGMLTVISLIDVTPILPSNSFEWQESAEYFIIIALATVCGNIVGRLMNLPRRKSQ